MSASPEIARAMTHQALLTQICWKYEEASRAMLHWYPDKPW